MSSTKRNQQPAARSWFGPFDTRKRRVCPPYSLSVSLFVEQQDRSPVRSWYEPERKEPGPFITGHYEFVLPDANEAHAPDSDEVEVIGPDKKLP